MEIEPGLRGGGSTGTTTLSTGEAVEQDYTGIPSNGQPEAELELGLGLSLGGGGGGGAKAKASAWGERGRLLTAKDFPAVVSYGGSSFSTISPKSTSDVAVSGVKRAASTAADSPASARQVVGWPPIRAYRMSNLINPPKTPAAEEDEERSDMDADGGGREKGSAGFVKVNMDGVVIGRKVDLTSHSCYQTLAMMLEDMFLTPNSPGSEAGEAKKWAKLLDGSSEFVLTYADKDGDWMLVGDVPWKMFVGSVRKLRLMRTAEATAAPRGYV